MFYIEYISLCILQFVWSSSITRLCMLVPDPAAAATSSHVRLDKINSHASSRAKSVSVNFPPKTAFRATFAARSNGEPRRKRRPYASPTNVALTVTHSFKLQAAHVQPHTTATPSTVHCVKSLWIAAICAL